MAQRSLPGSATLRGFSPSPTVLVLDATNLLTRTTNETNILSFLIGLRFLFVCLFCSARFLFRFLRQEFTVLLLQTGLEHFILLPMPPCAQVTGMRSQIQLLFGI